MYRPAMSQSTQFDPNSHHNVLRMPLWPGGLLYCKWTAGWPYHTAIGLSKQLDLNVTGSASLAK